MTNVRTHPNVPAYIGKVEEPSPSDGPALFGSIRKSLSGNMWHMELAVLNIIIIMVSPCAVYACMLLYRYVIYLCKDPIICVCHIHHVLHISNRRASGTQLSNVQKVMYLLLVPSVAV